MAKKKVEKAKNVSIWLFILGVALELASIIIAYTVGHPHTDVCPALVIVIPVLCFWLSLSAFIVAFAAFFTSALSRRKNYILFASIILVIVILIFARPILIQSGYGWDWCNVNW
jgi:uncharacterized BrkB/YihY/UPF0761 family membrane protein